MQRIAVFGCGYVGVVTAACLSRLGHRVACYDTDLTRIRTLASGEVPFFEPGLTELVREQLATERLSFTADANVVLKGARIAFIAVGTPTGPTGEADLTYVRQAAREIADRADDGVTVVNKSTVPVETADLVERVIHDRNPSLRFRIASNPEFLREGSAIGDFLHPDRIVIGVKDEAAERLLRSIYEPLGAPIVVVDLHTAEMIKYAANAFLATKVSFINEIANLCAVVGADIDGVVTGMGYDARIGASYLRPGLGFGGSCLPKDVNALMHVARTHSMEPTLLEAVLNVNRRQIVVALQMIERLTGDLDQRSVAVLGVAFKAGTDDIRDSPSLTLIEALLTRGAQVRLYDAHAGRKARARFDGRVEVVDTPYDAARGAAALVIANDEPLHGRLDWKRIGGCLAAPNVVDLRNRAARRDVEAAGLRYTGVGRNVKGLAFA